MQKSLSGRFFSNFCGLFRISELCHFRLPTTISRFFSPLCSPEKKELTKYLAWCDKCTNLYTCFRELCTINLVTLKRKFSICRCSRLDNAHNGAKPFSNLHFECFHEIFSSSWFDFWNAKIVKKIKATSILKLAEIFSKKL